MATKNRYSQPFNTIAVRASLPHLHALDPHPTYGKNRYNTQFLASKTAQGNADYLDLSQILAQIAEVVQCAPTLEAIHAATKSCPFVDSNNAIRDGDAAKFRDSDGFPGNIILTAKCDPAQGDMSLFELVDGQVVQMSRDEGTVKQKLYSGCWVVLRLVAGYSEEHKTVGLYIKSVTKVKDDERLGVPMEDQAAVVAGMNFSSIPGLSGAPGVAKSSVDMVQNVVPMAAPVAAPPPPVAAPPPPVAPPPLAAPIQTVAVPEVVAAAPVQSAKSLMDAAVSK